MEKLKSIKELRDYRDKLKERRERDKNKILVTLCGGTACRSYGCMQVVAAFEEEVKKQGLAEKVAVKVTGCHGFCEKGTLVVIHPKGVFYQRVKKEDVSEIIQRSVKEDEIIDRLLYQDPLTKKKIILEKDVPFYKHQQRIIFGMNGEVDPTNIDDYLSSGGYKALERVLTSMKPEEVIEEITKSGLRGRGGGGFPTGMKWSFTKKAPEEFKYVICNADEGDPGAYMDRSLLEGNPHSILEGMLIGAYAIGSQEGYIYVRAEYPLAVQNVGLAILRAKEKGLLGEDILGSGFNFALQIKEGAGAFVCGEETALIASLEGKRGMPRIRPPFPALSGLWEKPTNINNVETWANVPLIINRGVDWYASIGTEKSKGTKIFSLVGKINNTGLIEVPMGLTLREIVFNIGGGIKEGRKFKAVQLGGPSGGCLPESLIDTPVDYDSITATGAIMGSGGLVVMDETTCMVDIAKFFLNFTQDESCGKCTFCRVGTRRMLEVLDRITEGEGKEGDIESLEELALRIKTTSLCGLGQTAPNPVLTTLKYFKDEYQAHIKEKRCPARACKALLKFEVMVELCKKCGKCAKVCPTQAIKWEKKQVAWIDKNKCIKCKSCFTACKFAAIE
ncbi:NADH-quinone oxidoreductase subunit NuoF [bacterium]|nr:NADH-quinone oxidoreductase subunit NuoF [bacterium]MBU1154052.1 NADH-quinone oxidoreductase subunit NuoF [bacterium]MBU2599380.1 NADH-quinone oxidoreductase subunit NuoF [bacterium]